MVDGVSLGVIEMVCVGVGVIVLVVDGVIVRLGVNVGDALIELVGVLVGVIDGVSDCVTVGDG